MAPFPPGYAYVQNLVELLVNVETVFGQGTHTPTADIVSRSQLLEIIVHDRSHCVTNVLVVSASRQFIHFCL